MKKKKWKKPELIVLVRGKLEENVLRVCKRPGNFPDSCSPGRPGVPHAFRPAAS